VGTKSATITELELQAMLLSGDTRQFQIIYDRYCNALYGILHRIVHEDALAEDLLQEAFVKIWQKAFSYDASKGTVFTWMLNVTRNLALDKLRSADYSRSKQTFYLEDHVHITEDRASTETTIERAEIAQMVMQLEPHHRILIDMVYIQGYTQAEVAEKLSIPLGTVKTRIRSALQKLRTQM
jgi:RNA polymerase sigma-70 factor, ECF subfamily